MTSENLSKDIRYGWRSLLKRPGFTAIVVITLALGIGANTAIFTVANSVLLRPLPYQHSNRLVMIWGNFQKLSIERLSAKFAEYDDYRRQTHIFEQVAAFENQNLNLTGAEQAERIMGARVSSNLFAMLGALPEQGRGIAVEEGEIGRDKVVVLSNGFWQRHFGGKKDAVGQNIRLDDESYKVIGVMPASFQFPHASFPFAQLADVWLPLTYTSEQVAQRRGPYRLNVIALIRTDVTLDKARSEMNALGQRFEKEYRGYTGPHGEDGGWRITLAPVLEEAIGSSRRPLLLLLGAVALLLVIACANVANLLMVRAASRRKELAVRVALGASRWRIVRQMLVEVLMLAVSAGGLGFLIALWGVNSLSKLQSANLPRLQEIHVDERAFAFTALLTILTVVFFGLIPTWRASRLDLQRELKGKRTAAFRETHHSWRDLLLIGEVALSFLLLVGAGLLVNSFLRLQHIQPPIATSKLLAVEINLPENRYREPAQAFGFFKDLVSRVEALPGVAAASLGTAIPLSGAARNDPFAVEGRSLDPANISFAGWQTVSANYFHTLGIPLIRGRDLTWQDMDPEAPAVAVINETMARRYWPGENPIGKRLTVGVPRPENPWVTIIGIASDLPHRKIDSTPEPDWYLSRSLGAQRNQMLFVRTAGSPSDLATPVRNMVATIDPNQPVASIKTISEVVAGSVAPRKFNMMLFTLFASLALLLAGLGMYGVMAYSVTQRTHEVGIRMALGAQKSHVLRLILAKGMTITMIGIVLGLTLSIVLTRLMTALLFGITPTDTLTFVAVTVFVILVALLAGYLPARRATTLNPVTALRAE
jgi:predicted permease